MSGFPTMEVEAGIASTCPNAAVEHCHGKAGSPCDDSCAFCYVTLMPNAPVTRCPQCEKRKLCSVECMRRDWEVHQHFCGKAGEKNIDWAIMDCSEKGKGFGVVALRDFDFGEVIMAERCVAGSPEELECLEPASVKAAAMLLYGDTSEEKYEGYAMGRFEETRGIFLHLARINHSCAPTPVDHTWLEKKKCKILTACGNIRKGAELTFSYRGDMMEADVVERRSELMRQWGFECACEACRGLECGVAEYDTWLHYQVLDKQISRCVRRKMYPEALDLVKQQLSICRAAIFCAPVTFERCFFDLFQMHVHLGDLDAASDSARNAATYAAMVWGAEGEETAEYVRYAADPLRFFSQDHLPEA